MDAAILQSHRKQVIFFLTAALLLTGQAFAAAGTLTLSTTAVGLNSITTSAAVALGSTGDPIAFTAAVTSYDDGPTGPQNWLNVSPASGTTPGNVYVGMASIPSGVGPFHATVTITGGGGGTIAVTYTPGGSAGSPITVSPASLNLSMLVAGSVSGALTIQSSSPAATSFTVATAPGAGWTLQSDTTVGTVSSTSPATVTLTAGTTSSSVTTYTGSVTITPSGLSAITIPVSLAVGQAGGGGGVDTALTLTYNSTTTSHQSLSFTYGGGALPAAASMTVQGAAGAQGYVVQNITPPTATWLMTNATAGATNLFSQALQIGLTSAAQTLPTGTYTATVPMYSWTDTQNTASVTVTLVVNGGGGGLSITPTSWSVSATPGQTATQDFTVTAVAGVTITGVSADQSWLSAVATGTGTQNATASATVNPASLANGSYNGNVIVSSTNGTTSYTTNIPVSLTVTGSTGTGGGGPTGQIIAPGSLSFAYQAGSNAVVYPQQVFIPGSAGQSFAATSDSAWLTTDVTDGPLPATLSIRVDPSTLAVRTTPYAGNISVLTPNGQAVVPVTFTITNSPVLRAAPIQSMVFINSGSGYPSQAADIIPSNGQATAITVAPDSSWLQATATPDSFTGGATLSVSVDASALATGTYAGSVQITAAGMANSPMTYPVVLVVGTGGNGQGGTLTASPSSLAFTAAPAGAAQSQTVAVTSNTGATAFSATTSAIWLTVNVAGATTPANISVTVNPTGLAVGPYSGSVTLTAAGVSQTVSVSLTVSATSTGGNVTLDQQTLNFNYALGSASPAAQTITVSNASGSGSAPIPYTIGSSATWLIARAPGGALQGQTQGAVQVTIDPTGLSANTYSGTVTITPTGGTQQQVAVTLTVTTATITVDKTSLTFVYRIGDASKPASQTVQVSGGASATFTASASSTGGWLSVTPTSGNANPATLTISADPGSMSPGNYMGTVQVTGANGTAGSAAINVTLSVYSPLPVITQLGSAASYYSASISPGEIVSIFGTNLGPTTPVGVTLDSTGKVATTAGGVQVFFGGYPAPITYARGTQINCVAPYELRNLSSVNVWVKFMDQTSNTITLPVSKTAPGIFTADSSGLGPAAILNPDNSYNSQKPAAKGSTVSVYITGEGDTVPAGVTGKVTAVQAAPPLTPGPAGAVAVTIDGQPATVAFAGEAPYYVSGIMQLNVTIPANARSGALPIIVRVGNASSQTDQNRPVTVSVQ